MPLPKPDCCGGYTRNQVTELLGDRLPEFDAWMTGQTRMLCEGVMFDLKQKRYVSCGCETPHGIVTYTWDVERFLAGLPPLD